MHYQLLNTKKDIVYDEQQSITSTDHLLQTKRSRSSVTPKKLLQCFYYLFKLIYQVQS